jgi:flagellar hook-basal body protein
VDSTGSANVNERVVLTIPQKTSGEARQTSLVELGLNFPADAQVVTDPFNRANPATYNKSTAMTVYDNGGNGYLATVYYVKTANANQNSPFNKWQTFVFVGDDQVNASLVQATDSAGERLYVNQYGQIKPFGEVKDEITTAKTQLISLDELTDVRPSQPATVSSTEPIDTQQFDLTNGINFKDWAAQSADNKALLAKVFTLDVDGSNNPITVDLSYLADLNQKLTGNQVAAEMTSYLNRAFGDEAYFNLSVAANREVTVRTSRVVDTAGAPKPINVQLAQTDFTLPAGATFDWSKLTIEQVTAALQKNMDNNTELKAGGSNTVKVAYDYNLRTFKFTDGTNSVSIAQGAAGRNEVFGLGTTPVEMAEDGSNSLQVIPNGSMIRPVNEQRYGIKVSFDASNKTFAVKSGTTGDEASIKLTLDRLTTGDKSSLGEKLFGFKDSEVATSAVALRGIESSPAVAYGGTPTINVTNNFAVDNTNNRFVVTVDGVKGTVVIPTGNDYSVESFAAALQKGINSMANNTNGVPETVNGVRVGYDYGRNRFVFTTGTTSSDSFIKISGQPTWGLEQVEAGRGQTSTWIKPTQHSDLVGTQMVPKYIDSDGKETTNGDGYTVLPAWSPIFLDKGELTFDTGGKLVSPMGGTQLETVYLAGGKGALTINIDYSASTQFSSPFAVLSQSQDGAPEGDLVGVTIANDGLVSASYSNGTQKSLAKILLVNFSSPAGLRQAGDSSFLASAASGSPILGTAGTAGFGTIRAGATERSNVDLTQELVDLITAQRNFQANAKAIETSTTMTQAIINIRG